MLHFYHLYPKWSDYYLRLHHKKKTFFPQLVSTRHVEVIFFFSFIENREFQTSEIVTPKNHFPNFFKFNGVWKLKICVDVFILTTSDSWGFIFVCFFRISDFIILLISVDFIILFEKLPILYIKKFNLLETIFS